MITMTLSYRCSHCQKSFPVDEHRWCCDCGSFLDLEFGLPMSVSDIDTAKNTLWRYRTFLPIQQEDSIVSLGEGFTPLLPFVIEGKRIWLKMEQLAPTGSFKDRGASVLISKLKELGVKEIVEDSSGNAGSAIAAYAAAAGIRCHIFVPRQISPAKTQQISAYGADLHMIEGDRQATAEAALQAAQSRYYASHVWNPFFFQGTKTMAYELCEQNHWSAPDTLILPVGNGSLLLGARTGFRELLAAGIIASLPRLIAVQSTAFAPLYDAFFTPSDSSPDLSSTTIAEGIAIAHPPRLRQIIAAIRESGGTVIRVNDIEISEAQDEMAARGLYIEATSAVAIAGLKMYLDSSTHRDELIVCPITGHGLKTHPFSRKPS